MYKITHEIMKTAEWAAYQYVEWMLERKPSEREVSQALAGVGIWEKDEELEEIRQWIESAKELVEKGTSPEFFKERDWCAIVNGRYLGLDYSLWEYFTFIAK